MKYTILLKDGGFAITDAQPIGFFQSSRAEARELASARWASVLRVVAVKRASSAVEQFCFDVQVEDGRRIEVHEDMIGWDAFISAATKELAGFRRDWWEPSFHVIFERNPVD